MNEYIPEYSPRSSLAVIGLEIQRLGIWGMIEKHVKIKQKVIKHTPSEKLLDAFINILAGGHGLVEVNTRVAPDPVLQQAFGRERCADQSTISDTLNACTAENVAQTRQAVALIYRHWSRGYRHPYRRQYQLLDVDLSGLSGGRQGEGVTKGVFADRRQKRGRQVGRVVATHYEEIVVERLYPGNVQLVHSLQELVTEAEGVLQLDERRRRRTIVRVDGGGGRDEDLNWLLDRGYGVVAKVKNWKRTKKLTKSVTEWYEDPQTPGRQLGWVQAPHPYHHPTRQLVMRKRKPDGKWYLRALVFNLDDATLFQLAGDPCPRQPTERDLLLAAMHAYDKRGGAAETSIKGSKQGLGINRRYKGHFPAQEMLLLLAQLAANLIVWVRGWLAAVDPFWQQFGVLRMVRDVFHIPGYLVTDGHLRYLQLNHRHRLAQRFAQAVTKSMLCIHSPPILGQI